jgi:hypothetical protein
LKPPSKNIKDVLAWSYDDLEAYKSEVIKHTIPLKEGAKPYRSEVGSNHLRELQKMLEAKIIPPTRHSSWVANLVHVRMKMAKLGYVWILKT